MIYEYILHLCTQVGCPTRCPCLECLKLVCHARYVHTRLRSTVWWVVRPVGEGGARRRSRSIVDAKCSARIQSSHPHDMHTGTWQQQRFSQGACRKSKRRSGLRPRTDSVMQGTVRTRAPMRAPTGLYEHRNVRGNRKRGMEQVQTYKQGKGVRAFWMQSSRKANRGVQPRWTTSNEQVDDHARRGLR